MKKRLLLIAALAMLLLPAHLYSEKLMDEFSYLPAQSDVFFYTDVRSVLGFLEKHEISAGDFLLLLGDDPSKPLDSQLKAYKIKPEDTEEILFVGQSEGMESKSGILAFLRVKKNRGEIPKTAPKGDKIHGETIYQVDKAKEVYVVKLGDLFVFGYKPLLSSYLAGRKAGQAAVSPVLKSFISHSKNKSLYILINVSRNIREQMNQAIQKGSAYGKGLNQNVFIKAILSLESIEGGVNLGEGISLFGSLQSSNPQDGGKLVMVSHFMIVGTSLAVSFMDAWAKSMGNPNLKTSEDDMAKIQAIFGRIKTKPMDNGVQISFTMTKDETDITVKKMKESIQKAKEERKKRLEKEKIGKLNDAIRKGDMEKVRSILAAGVEINGADQLGQVPLLVACEANSAESVKLLLEKGAEAAVAAKDGSTPLHICAASGNVEILKLLAQKNPNINARTRKGLTPLHIAAGKGHLPMVKALVERRADLMAEDDGEEKPADKARVNGHAEVAEYLDKLMKKPQGEDKGQE